MTEPKLENIPFNQADFDKEQRAKRVIASRKCQRKNPQKYTIERNAIRRERYDSIINTESNRKRLYKISPAQFDILYAEQNGLCDICGNPIAKTGRTTTLDHCHVSGKFRGILCSKCNRGIGLFNDSIQLMKKALAYLERYA